MLDRRDIELDDAILEDDDADVLINVNLVDEEKAELNRENLRKAAGLAGIADQEDEDVLLGLRQKEILSKYDNEINGVRKDEFTLGETGVYNPETERMLRQLQEEMRAGKQSLPDTELRVASEYYTEEELKAKFKKRKKRIKTRARTTLTADDLVPDEELKPVTSTSDLGSRAARESHSGHDEERPSVPDPLSVIATTVGGQTESNIDAEVLEDLPRDEEEEDELRGDIENTIQRVIRAKSTVYLKPEEVAAQLLARKEEENASVDKDQVRRANSTDQSSGVIFDSTAEFYKSIGAGFQESMRQNARLNAVKREVPRMNRRSIRLGWKERRPNRWQTVGEDSPGRRRLGTTKTPRPSTSNNADDDTYLTGVLDDEPCLNSGLMSALKLAEKKGYIEKGQEKRVGTGTMVNLMAKHFVQEDIRYDDIDAKFAKRDRYSGPLSEFKELKNFKPDVKLEYVDELGRQLNAKEAFRQLSHKFHGKGSGKKKTEKRTKKIKEEFLLKASTSSDTPLGTAEKLNKKLESISLPYVILSGKNAAV
ncbi:unnamed protein product [Echinostoma caproni]|uniref:U4/U6.U5 tri-snRNP-associated protein 1 n=1 Tax=Echinostoma caproni TaxID=27848 RepID=A0A183AI98_9TREM|nr:unnamed protein product [Echinostoma caproni]